MFKPTCFVSFVIVIVLLTFLLMYQTYRVISLYLSMVISDTFTSLFSTFIQLWLFPITCVTNGLSRTLVFIFSSFLFYHQQLVHRYSYGERHLLFQHGRRTALKCSHACPTFKRSHACPLAINWTPFLSHLLFF